MLKRPHPDKDSIEQDPAKKQKPEAEDKPKEAPPPLRLFDHRYEYRHIDIISTAEREIVCTVARLESEEKDPDPIRGMLVIDIDDTLYDVKKTREQRQLFFILKEKLIDVMKYAKQKNIKVVLMTAREYIKEIDSKMLNSVIKILNHFPPQLFSSVYFTNCTLKLFALKYIQTEYPHLQNKDICLIDDAEEHYQPCCDAGYTVIEVTQGDDHTELMRQFVDLQCERVAELPSDATPAIAANRPG